MTDQPDPIRSTRFRHQHDEITTPEKDRNHQDERPQRVETQTQIDRLERRKSIEETQAEPARRYFADAYYSGTVPSASRGALDRVDGTCEAFSERHVAASQRRANAIRALGCDLTQVVEWVCVDDYSPQTWAIKRREHPMAGIAVFRVAMTALAKHYGLVRGS